MAAPANANNTTPFFGCKISLISKSEIRYEGILYTIDPKESTIALAKVRSFGSEDRPVERPVPPRDDVFEFIIFRASDIKDLIVDDPPPTPALTDPAIIQAHSTSTSFPSSFPQASINAAAPAPVAPVGPTAPQQTPIQQLQQAKSSSGPTGGLSVPKQNETHTDSNKSKNATSSNAPPNYSRAAGGGSGSVTQQQTRQPNQRQNLQFNKQQQNKPSGEQSQQSSQAPNRSNNNQQPQQNAQNQNGYARRNQQNQSHGSSQQNRVIGENQNPNYHSRNGGQQQNQGGFRPFNSQHRFAPRQGQGQQQLPQQHQFSGGFRRGGGPGGVSGGPRNFISRPLNQHNGPKFPPLPDGDFDFEKAQADFKILEEKLHALKLNGSLGEVAEGPSADTTDVVVPGIPASAISVAALEQEEQELPKEACYNKQKSFFDQISCEALEREKGSSHRVDWKQERKMNRETFGAVSARRPTFFRVNNRGGGFGGGYHQHRGGYYNQRGGSGGFYQNRNYQNRQPRSQNASGAGGSNNVSSTTNSTRTPAKSTPNGVGASPSSSAAPIAIATKN